MLGASPGKAGHASRAPSLTIRSLVEEAAKQNPLATALVAPGRKSGTYSDLLAAMDNAARVLHGYGIGPGDPVAMVLGNGLDTASAFLSVAAVAACAPLNPRYRASELDFYLSDLKARAVIVDPNAPTPAAALARERGIPTIEISSRGDAPCGVFELRHDPAGGRFATASIAAPQDTALLLHTSGTTSQPKLVRLTHANLCHSGHNIRQWYQLTTADRGLIVMPLFHVHGLIGALLSSIAAGASVVCPPEFAAPDFFEWMAEFRPTWYTAAPAIHQAIADRAASDIAVTAADRLRFIRSCSSALPARLMAELEQIFQAPVLEAYGMTEAAHQITSNPLPPQRRKPGSVGVATGAEIAILSDSGAVVGPGETGHVVIRGPNVTPGSAGGSENAEVSADGWFHTGDRGYLDEDGYLFLDGRSKELINRGGEKISPREIDEVLLEHPAVAQAMAFAMPSLRLGEEVAAAIVLRPDAVASEQELREFVSSRLADFKIPRRIMFVPEIPKGPSGKPQRLGAAAKLGLATAEPEPAAFVPPRNFTESLICGIWQQVLARAQVGIHDNFWHIGGDSLLAMRMLARLQEAMGAEVPLVALFDAQTPELLAARVDSSEARSPAALSLSTVPRPANGELPLSFAQERMWFLAQLEGDAAPYIRAAGYRLSGPLNRQALERSLSAVIERHEVLRTTYHSRNGIVVQVVNPARQPPLQVTDLAGMNEPARSERLRQLAREQVDHAFDLSTDLMLRTSLVILAREEHRLLVAMHHIASDGWSSGVFLRDLRAFYEAFAAREPASLPELPAQYGHYAVWRRTLATADLDAGLSYWKQQLAGLPPLLGLFTDRPRPTRQTFRGGRESLVLTAELADALEAQSRASKTTLFMTLLAAFQILLYRLTGSEDIAVGCPVANRPHPHIEDLIGLFVNTIVIRTDLSGAPSFLDLLSRVRQTAMSAYAHQGTPFEKVVEALQPERSLSYSPLFQVMFQSRNLGSEVSQIGQLQVEPLDFDPGTAQFDLTLDVQPFGGSWRCAIEYNQDLFDASTAQRMLANYRTLLDGIVANPAETLLNLPILTADERQRLLVERNQTRVAFPQLRLPELFQQQAEKNPEARAVMFDGGYLNYHELNLRSNQLANHLMSLGMGPGTLVGLCLERSLDLVVALLGILKAGCAYLPLDLAFPPSRLGFILEDSRIQALVTHRDLDQRVPIKPRWMVHLDKQAEQIASQSTGYPTTLPGVGQEDIAYVLYTSGSTGQPKGVEISHSALVNCLLSMQSEPGFSETDKLLAVTTLSFDIAGLEIYLPLISGGSVVIAGSSHSRDPIRLMELLRQSQCTVMQATPSLWRALVDAGWNGSQALKILCGGEALSSDLVRALLPRCAELWNMYGPTETTIWSAIHRITSADGAISIGRPIANTEIFLLDANRNLVPEGVAGELYIGGAGLAGGYLHRPDLTKERFIQNPFQPDARLYRSGDLARWLSDGTLEYLGRVDDQVKIRGHRVEPSEVEAAIVRYPGVSAVAVAGCENETANRRLVAWIVACPGETLSVAGLRRHLVDQVPDYMLPSQFVCLPSLPLLPSGKVDRRSLNVPIPEPLAPAAPPRNESERRLCSIWRELLAAPEIGVHDNFFDLGGHSLLIAKMAARIEEEFNFRVAFSDLFESPTIAELAQAITGGRTSTYPPHVVPFRAEGTALPFFCFGANVAFRPIAQRLDPEQPVFGLVFAESDAEQVARLGTVEAIAAELVQSLRQLQPNGPYHLGGHSVHGLYAYEAARQLRADGHEVALLVLFDTFLPLSKRPWTGLAKAYLFSWSHPTAAMLWKSCRMMWSTLRSALLARMPKRVPAGEQAVTILPVWQLLSNAKTKYVSEDYDGLVTLIEAADQPLAREVGARFGWVRLAAGGLDIRIVPGEHFTMMEAPHWEAVADELNACLRAAKRKYRPGGQESQSSRAAAN